MRRAVSILLLLLLWITALRPYAPYLEYQVRLDEIASTLCVNADRPEMNCRGQCHLRQRLKELSGEQDLHSTQPASPRKLVMMVFFDDTESLALLPRGTCEKPAKGACMDIPARTYWAESPAPPPRLS